MNTNPENEPLRLLQLNSEQEADADRKMAEFEAWERQHFKMTRKEQKEALHSSMCREIDPMDRYEEQPSRVTP